MYKVYLFSERGLLGAYGSLYNVSALRSQHEVWGQMGRVKNLDCTDRQSQVKNFPLNAVVYLGFHQEDLLRRGNIMQTCILKSR